MHSRGIGGIAAAVAFSLSLGSAAARAPFVLDPVPETIEEIFGLLRPENPASIPAYLEGAQCGGWNQTLHIGEKGVETGAPGFVARVEGFPGKNYLPIEDIDAGVAKSIDTGGAKDDGFFFPANADGKTTVCRGEHTERDPATGRPAVKRIVWDDAARQRIEKWFPYPYFEDPPCLWGPSDAAPNFATQGAPPHSLEKCTAFCNWLNTFVYQDCPQENIELVAIGGQGTATVAAEPPRPQDLPSFMQRLLAELIGPPLDLPVEPPMIGPPIEPGPNEPPLIGPPIGHPPPRPKPQPEPPPRPAPEPPKKPRCRRDGWRWYSVCNGAPVDTWPNCKQSCTGEECRCPGPGCVRAPAGQEYRSFYRQYTGSYERGAVPDVPTDIAEKNVRAACYGFYDEFSVDLRKTERPDWRCAVDIEDVGGLQTSQTGKGTYTASDERDEMPDVAPPNAETDLWVPLSGAFALLQERVFQEKYDGQLANVYRDTESLDRAQQIATSQLPTRPFAQSTTMREFDDTGMQSIVRWWRKQQNAMQRLLRRGTVFLLLPPRGALGLDLGQPPFAPEPLPQERDDDPQSRPMRVQLQAGEDLLGQVLRSIRLPVEEVPIPLALYASSVTEINALKEAWCMRIIRETGMRTCTEGPVPAPVRQILTTLDQYAAYMENIRVLRSSLARHVGDILHMQNAIAAPVAAVLRGSLGRYRLLLQQQALIIGSLMPLWRQAEAIERTFSTSTNQPYCMEQRFTAPVKSLLDSWLPARSEGGSAYEKGVLPGNSLPTLEGLVTEPATDIVIDLSRVPTVSIPILLPVFKPILMRINWPKPPDLGTRLTEVRADLPEPPDITAIEAAMQAAQRSLPAIDTTFAEPPVITFPPLLGAPIIAEAQRRLGAIVQVLAAMNDSYASFWHSIFAFAGLLAYPEPSCGEEGDLAPLTLCGWNTLPSLPEMNLVEMIMRVASRPRVNLIEDYASRGWPRSFPTVCLATDPACAPLPPEELPAPLQWETVGPAADDTGRIDQLRSTVLDTTLPAPVGRITLPPLDIEREELLPAVQTPSPITLPPAP